MLVKSSHRRDTFDANNSLSYLPNVYVLPEPGALGEAVEVEAEKNKNFIFYF